MTPAQLKAAELIEKFKKATSYKYQEYAGANYSTFEHDIETLKQCAIIHVNEIIEVLERKWFEIDFWTEELGELMKYWQEVKKELSK